MHYMIASAHSADLHREAAGARLAKLATRCQPSALSNLVSRLRGGGTQDCSA